MLRINRGDLFMSFIRWDHKYRTEVEFLDHQHQTILNLANELVDQVFASNKHGDVAVITKMIDDLMRQVKNHLANEENLMLEYGYPEYQTHKKEHESMMAYGTQLLNRFKAERLVISFPTYMFMKNWVERHLLEDDQKYGRFLRNIVNGKQATTGH
jgi:hemerythrin